MKRQLSSLDVKALMQEMRALEGSRLEKAYHFDGSEVLLRFKSGGRHAGIRVSNGKYLAVSETSTAEGTLPTSFAMLLRKHLAGAILSRVEQQAFDRVVSLEFSVAEGPPYKLFIEVTKEGNVILTREGKIVQPLLVRDYGRRALRANIPYVPPPLTPDPSAMEPGEFLSAMRASKADVVRTLATRIGLGGTYAEEACLLAGVDKGMRPGELGEHELESLLKSVAAMSSRAAAPLEPQMICEGACPIDVTPFPLKVHEGKVAEGFPSFSSAIMRYFETMTAEASETAREDGRAANIEAQRREMISKLTLEAERLEQQADLLFVHFTHFSQILSTLNAAPKGKALIAAVKALPPSSGVVVLDALEGKVGAAMPGTDENVPLLSSKDIHGNAASLYEAAKGTRLKLEGAVRSLDAGKKPAQAKKREKGQRKRRFWFERYRWFVTSDGHLSVAGRDAGMNEEVVKKHLKERDLYAHADVQGAPSVVLKAEDIWGKPLPDFSADGLEEACEFSLLHSKAWNAGLATGSSYWVVPDQVSKTPNPGEFLPKGAFVIRGKRNYAHKISVKASLCAFEHNGERIPFCGPERAVAAVSKDYLTIVPGETKKSEFAKEAARRFALDIEDVMRALPPGDVRILPKEE